jgi:hypothetical protein
LRGAKYSLWVCELKIKLVSALILLIAVPALSPSANTSGFRQFDWSHVNVVSIYQPIPLEYPPQTLMRILADTGTEIVWHATYTIPRNMQDSEDSTGWWDTARVVKYVKQRMPWVFFQGAVDAYDWCGRPDLSIVYSKGSYPMGYPGCYALDITKPNGSRVVINYAERLIDAGFELLHFDCIDCLRGSLGLPRQPYLEAWKQISSAVKEYARTKYGKEIPVTINNYPTDVTYPSQDYLDLGFSGPEMSDMVRSGSFPIPWDEIKAKVTETFGHIPPIIFFIDSGGPGDPMPVFASLSRDDQIKELNALHNMSLQQGVHFAYPLHGLGTTPYEIITAPGLGTGTSAYDPVKQGTYEAIKRLTNSLSEVHTMTVTETITVNRTITAISPDLALSIALSAAVLGTAIVLVGIVLKWRRLSSKRSTNRLSA